MRSVSVPTRTRCRFAEAILSVVLLAAPWALGTAIDLPVPSTERQKAIPDQIIFGPREYVRSTKGKPNIFSDSVQVPAGITAPFLLRIENGVRCEPRRGKYGPGEMDVDDGDDLFACRSPKKRHCRRLRTDTARVVLNGQVIVNEREFSRRVAFIEKVITLRTTNTLTVQIAGQLGDRFTLSLLGARVRPFPIRLTPNPLPLVLGSQGMLTATLRPAPPISGTLTVRSSHPHIATAPATVLFTAGQVMVPVSVNAVGVGTSIVSVTLNGRSVSSLVKVTGSPPTITSLVPSLMPITQGATGSLTVTISGTQVTDVSIALTSSAPEIVFVPGSIVVTAGQLSAVIPVSGNTSGTAQITAALNGSTASSIVTVSPSQLIVVSVLPPKLPITLGGVGTFTVALSAAQASDTVVQLTATPEGILIPPSSVTVKAGQISAPVMVGTAGLGLAMIQARLQSSTAEAAVQVVPESPDLTALGPSPFSIAVGATAQLTVQVNAVPLVDAVISLTADSPTILEVPGAITVPSGQNKASVTIKGLLAGDTRVKATTTSGSQVTAIVHVAPPPPILASLSPNPLVLQQGATGSLTIGLNAAQSTDTIVSLANSDPAILLVPATITIIAGNTGAQVPVTGLVKGSALVTATLNGATVSASIQVVAPPIKVTGLTPGTLTFPKGTIDVLRVTVNPVPIEPTPIALASSSTITVTVPATVTVAAGSDSAELPVLGQGEGSATITASLNGTVSAQVTVTPAELVALTLSPTAPSIFVGQTQAFGVEGTYTDGAKNDLTNSVTWISSDSAVATIDANGLAIGLTAGATTITAKSGSEHADTTLTVQIPPALTIAPSLATVQIGQFLALTISSTVPADSGGLLVTLTAAGTGSVVVPGSILMPPNQASVSVIVSGAAPGVVTLTASAIGRAPATSTLTVALGVPTISSFSPLTGPPGTVVTINGINFDPAPGKTTVSLNGAAAIISSITTRAITTTVPMGAVSGTVRVTTPLGTATSTTSFVVTSSQDFTLTALPATLGIPASGQGAFAVSLSGSPGYSSLVSLVVKDVPPGMSASLSTSTLTAGQSGILSLVTNGTTPAGSHSITVTGTTTIDGVQITRSVALTVQVQGIGVTNLSGQVLDEEDKPVKGAKVKLGSLETFTDDGGNFLLVNPPVGPDQLLFIDGGPASTAEHSFPIIPYKVTIVAGATNTLGYVPHLHFQKTVGLADISNSSTERTVTVPELPGFKMTIPAGVTITGWDGQPDTQISIRRVPADRLPIPASLPGDRYSPVVYMDYFGRPGGGVPSVPIPITLPNDLEAPPGTKVELWFYDEAPDGSRPNEWRQYGTGTVSADGTQIDPDIDPTTGKPYGQPRFCCGALRAALASLNGLVGFEPLSAHGEGSEGGDPVDLATGIFIVKKTDLVLPGRFPVVVTRMYRTIAANNGPFGIGTSHSYHILLLIENNMRTLVLPGGARVLFVGQANGTFRNMTAPSYQGAVLTVTGSGHVLRFKDGSTWTFGPDTLGTAFLTAQSDRNGNTIRMERSGLLGTLNKIIDSAGREIVFSYTGNAIAEIRDPMGRTIRYTYDASGRLASVTDPAGAITRYTYDPVGRMVTLTDARGITFLTNEYADDGRVKRQIQADGGIWQFAYTLAGGAVSKTTVTDPLGHPTTYRFNGQGYLVEQTDALGQTTIFTRDSNSNLLQATTDPLGRKTSFKYDAAGNITSITDPAGNTTGFTYDPTFNRLMQITDTLGQQTRFTYDAKGNLLTTTDPLNQTTMIAYNEFGQPTSVTDPLGNRTTFAYDGQGNLATTIDPLGNATQRAYDAVSRLTSLTDPRGFATQFQYDPLNRVTSIAAPDHGITRFSYDPNGNLLEVGDAKGQVTAYTYDVMDRLSTRTDPLARQEAYLYDHGGNLTQFRDRKHQVTTFSYDAANRRTRSDFADGSTTNFIYDSVGRLMTAQDSLSGRIELSYDQLDRLVQETTAQGTVSYQYDALGRRTNMTANGQSPVTYQYDAASRLTRVAQGSQVVGLSYDAAGRRMSLSYPNGTNTSYAYDAASRLTRILHDGPSSIIDDLLYTYDAAGNRISFTRANGAATLLPAPVQAAYDAANEQIQFNSLTPNLTYDANGNLTSQTDASGTTTYTWDARNRLTAISGPGVSASFVYDALGRRVSKTINGVTTQYLYDGNDIVAEIGGTSVAATYLRSLTVDDIFVRLSNRTEYFHADAIGSFLALSNSSGALAVSYGYEPFAQFVVTGDSTNPFRYTGRENDGNAFYYYRARYYSPTFSRFTQEDPLGLLGGINRYAYVDNNPTNRIDPFGLAPFCGTGVLTKVVPDSWWGKYSFSNACNEHDSCYSTCGASRSKCDDAFFANMAQECKRLDGYWARDCFSTAVVYYKAVQYFGEGPYRRAQGPMKEKGF